jgi:anaerobic ribonucleoside-triphosphate reductase activating protein
MTPNVISLNKAHYPVTTLGYGNRVGIWLQGCTLACPGCISRDTWEKDPNKDIPITTLLNWIKNLPNRIDGITISGGEPFQQPSALAELLERLHEWRSTQPHLIDHLVYSGYPEGIITKRYAHILERVDILIAEPYDWEQPQSHPLAGSGNQVVRALTPLGHDRVHGETPGKHLQVVADGTAIWYIGIPQRGDMERIEAHLQTHGIHQTGVSWRP